MWYYVTEQANEALLGAAAQRNEKLAICEKPPKQAELVFLERRDVPFDAVHAPCIGIGRSESSGIAGWVYHLPGEYDEAELISVARGLCGRYAPERLNGLIEECLSALSIPKHLLGFRYLTFAIAMLLQTEHPYGVSLMNDIYPLLGERTSTSPKLTSRAIRHAIERAWRDGARATQQSYFGYSALDKRGIPTNVETVFSIYERVRLLAGDQNFVRERPNTAQR